MGTEVALGGFGYRAVGLGPRTQPISEDTDVASAAGRGPQSDDDAPERSPTGVGRLYSALSSSVTADTDFLASPNSIVVPSA